MRETRDGELASYELVMHMVYVEAGPDDENRVTLESADCSGLYSGERLIMDMANEDVRRNYGGRFKVTVAPMGERDEPDVDGIPAFADLCEGNAAAVATATREQLEKVWSVGDELRMHLAASTDGRQPEQGAVWVVMGFGDKDMATGGKSRAVIGLKDGLASTAAMSGARQWLNSGDGFTSMVPGWFCSLFGITANRMPDGITTDIFWLPSEVEVFGCTQHSDGEMEQREEQLPYYVGRRDRRIKRQGVDGDVCDWWERSILSGSFNDFCRVYSDGSADAGLASDAFLLSPCGCI